MLLLDATGFYGSIKMTNKYEVPASFSWKPSEDDAREKAAFYPQHSSGMIGTKWQCINYQTIFPQALFLQIVHWNVNLFIILLMIILTLLHLICSWMVAEMKQSSALQRYCVSISENTPSDCGIVIVQEAYMSIF